jgi:hypothetical protein
VFCQPDLSAATSASPMARAAAGATSANMTARRPAVRMRIPSLSAPDPTFHLENAYFGRTVQEWDGSVPAPAQHLTSVGGVIA